MALFVQKADERLDRDRFVKDGYIVVRGLFTPPELAGRCKAGVVHPWGRAVRVGT